MFQQVSLPLCVFYLLFQVSSAVTPEDVSLQVTRLVTVVSASSYNSISQIDSWIEELDSLADNATAETRADLETNIQYIYEQINSTVLQANSGGFDLSSCSNSLEYHITHLRESQYTTTICINKVIADAKIKALRLTGYFESRIGQAQSLQQKVEPCGTEQGCLLELQSNITKLRVTLPLLNQLDVEVALGNVNSTYSNRNDMSECSRTTSIGIDGQRRAIISSFSACANLLVNDMIDQGNYTSASYAEVKRQYRPTSFN